MLDWGRNMKIVEGSLFLLQNMGQCNEGQTFLHSSLHETSPQNNRPYGIETSVSRIFDSKF